MSKEFKNADNREGVQFSPEIAFSSLISSERIEINGNIRLNYEGKYSIVEYTDQSLKVKSGRKFINLEGEKLNLMNVTDEGFSVIGRFSSLKFE